MCYKIKDGSEGKKLLPVAFPVTKFHFGLNERQRMTPLQAALYYLCIQPLTDRREIGGWGQLVSVNE